MKPSLSHPPEADSLPCLSSQGQGWEPIRVEKFHPLSDGDCRYSSDDHHTICLSLAARPVPILQIREGKTYTGLHGKGDISVLPAKMPFFIQWQGEDHYLQISIKSDFIQSVAREALNLNPDRLELISEFKTRDPQIEAVGLLLLTGLQQENLGGRVYIESLANLLAIHLIREYTHTNAPLPVYEGGLSQRQLVHTLDYIHAHLDCDIKLADLANPLGISQFHFSKLFKQSLGTTPYQYLLQQRIEKAKQFLKESNHSIMDIALSCGFNSHSHLSKQFRQLTGVTPKAYRIQYAALVVG